MQIHQHFSDKNFIGKNFLLDIIEKEKEAFIVLAQQGKNKLVF